MVSPINWAERNPGTVILGIVLAILASMRLPAEAQNTTVTGVVKNASGEAVAGALVRVRSADLGLGFLVVSQVQGRYSTPNLLPGKYTVQGFGGGYQSDLAGPVEVASGQPGKMDLRLNAPQKMPPPPAKRMTNAEYAQLMPEGDAKRLLITRCVLCHDLDRIVPARKTREGWLKTVSKMRLYLGARPDLRGALSDEERDVIFEYVVKNFGPETPPLPREGGPSDPNRHLPRTLLQGAEARFVAMELDLRSRALVHDIETDSQGIAWVSEQEPDKGIFGRFDPQSLTYTRITTPPPARFPERQLGALAVDSQDQVWIISRPQDPIEYRGFSPYGLLLQYNPKTKEFNKYDLPTPLTGEASLYALRFLDGSVWGTGNTASRIIKLDPSTGKVTDYPLPMGSHPFGLAIGGDQMIWYVAMYANEVVRLDPNTDKRTAYKVPTPRSELRQIAADAEGNLWATGEHSGKLMKVDYRTGQITEYNPPTKDSGPYSVNVDLKRNLIWFNEGYTDKIGRFDPRSNTFLEFPLPTADSQVVSVGVDRTNPNRVWWGGSRIGYIEAIE